MIQLNASLSPLLEGPIQCALSRYRSCAMKRSQWLIQAATAGTSDLQRPQPFRNKMLKAIFF